MSRSHALTRAATPDDADALAALCGELGYSSTARQVRERLRLLGDAERTLLVAEPDDGLAGFIDMRIQRVVEADPCAGVGDLVVASGHRGEGLGAALPAAAAGWARERSLAAMWIRANLARDGVHDFYPAVGCRRVKDQRVCEYTL